MTIPSLSTRRLRLRAPVLADFPRSLAMWSDPIVVRHLGGKPNEAEEVWRRLLGNIGHWAALGYGYWAVETLDGDYVGEVGWKLFRRGILPELEGAPEAGWVLAARAHGQGIGLEAAGAAMAWRDRALPAGPSVCIIDPDNAASLRVADRLGFAQPAAVRYRDAEVIALRR